MSVTVTYQTHKHSWCLFVHSLQHNVQVSKNIFNAVFVLRERLQMLVFKRLEGWTLTTLFKLLRLKQAHYQEINFIGIQVI